MSHWVPRERCWFAPKDQRCCHWFAEQTSLVLQWCQYAERLLRTLKKDRTTHYPATVLELKAPTYVCSLRSERQYARTQFAAEAQSLPRRVCRDKALIRWCQPCKGHRLWFGTSRLLSAYGYTIGYCNQGKHLRLFVVYSPLDEYSNTFFPISFTDDGMVTSHIWHE